MMNSSDSVNQAAKIEAEYEAFTKSAGLDDDTLDVSALISDAECKLCEKSFSFANDRVLHEQGRGHKRMIRYEKERLEREEQKKRGLICFTKVETVTPSTRDDKWLDLIDWILVANVPLLGFEHIYEIHRYRFIGYNYYICDLCWDGHMPIFSHLISKRHIVNYINAHYDELKETINKMVLNTTERNCLDTLLRKKDAPLVPEDLPLSPIETHRLLIYVANGIGSKHRRNRVRIWSETMPSGLTPERQPSLMQQIGGHVTGHYSEELLDKLHRYGSNFTIDPDREPRAPIMRPYIGFEEDFIIGDLNPPSASPLPPPVAMGDAGVDEDAPISMGVVRARARAASAPAKLSLLRWLYKTALKLETEPLQPSDIEQAMEVAALLKCGIDIFSSKAKRSDICHFTETFDPNSNLSEWLVLTVRFFSKAWLCSEREVNLAKVVISMIDLVTDQNASPNDPYSNDELYQDATATRPAVPVRHRDPLPPPRDLRSLTPPGERYDPYRRSADPYPCHDLSPPDPYARHAPRYHAADGRHPEGRMYEDVYSQSPAYPRSGMGLRANGKPMGKPYDRPMDRHFGRGSFEY